MAFNDHITHVTALKKQPNYSEAIHLLQTVATKVKPLMRAHSWHVRTLREFQPADPRLLGLNKNRGQEICIRLRPAHDSLSFYDMDHLIGTMLHELTHIVHGPHNAAFYAFLDALNNEYDELVAKGWKGDGFFAPGQRVGIGIFHDLPVHLARQKALDAAEKRKVVNGVMIPSGGRRLGGSTGLSNLGLSSAQLAAMAAERRAKDNVWCGSADDSTPPSANPPPSPEIREDPPSTSSYPSGSAQNPIRVDPVDSSNAAPPFTTTQTVGKRKSRRSSSPPQLTGLVTNEQDWPCPHCTLLNRHMALQCDGCWSVRPSCPPPPASKRMPPPLPLPRAGHDDDEAWSCPQCTLVNAAVFRMCRICEFVRPA